MYSMANITKFLALVSLFILEANLGIVSADNRMVFASAPANYRPALHLRPGHMVAPEHHMISNQPTHNYAHIQPTYTHYYTSSPNHLSTQCSRQNELARNASCLATAHKELSNQVRLYTESIHALTSLIQDLDDSLEQYRVGCNTNTNQRHLPSWIPNPFKPTTNAPQTTDAEAASLMKTTETALDQTTTTTIAPTTTTTSEPAVRFGSGMNSLPSDYALAAPLESIQSSPSQPIFDSESNKPLERVIRDATTTTTALPTTQYYGQPSATTPFNENKDLIATSSELKRLRLELEKTSILLRSNDLTVHSAMFRALQAYVSSIERRVDRQISLGSSSFVSNLRPRIEAVKAKVSELFNKLKDLLPSKPFSTFSSNNSTTPAITNNTQVDNTTTTTPKPFWVRVG